MGWKNRSLTLRPRRHRLIETKRTRSSKRRMDATWTQSLSPLSETTSTRRLLSTPTTLRSRPVRKGDLASDSTPRDKLYVVMIRLDSQCSVGMVLRTSITRLRARTPFTTLTDLVTVIFSTPLMFGNRPLTRRQRVSTQHIMHDLRDKRRNMTSSFERV